MAPFRRLRQALGLRKGKPSRYVKVGRGTYGVGEHTVVSATAATPVFIGSFCSIGAGVEIHGETHHHFDTATTYPFRHMRRGEREPDLSKGSVVIGHDVWIGSRAIILAGVEIGHGAVIGAGSVVSRNVPPYAVVAGSPARLIRHRFDAETVARLLRIAWWDWPDSKLDAEVDSFYLPIHDFIARHEQTKAEVA